MTVLAVENACSTGYNHIDSHPVQFNPTSLKKILCSTAGHRGGEEDDLSGGEYANNSSRLTTGIGNLCDLV